MAPAAQVATVLAELRARITLESGRAAVREWSAATHPGVARDHYLSSDVRSSAEVDVRGQGHHVHRRVLDGLGRD